MADSELVEAVKLFGGIAGLGTAAFTIYDRLWRDRPIASLFATNETFQFHHFLRVRNPSTRDVSLGPFETSDKRVRVGLGDSLDAVLEEQFGFHVPATITPETERTFYIWVDNEFIADQQLIPVRFIVHWQFTGRRLAQIPIRLHSNNRELKALADDAERTARARRER